MNTEFIRALISQKKELYGQQIISKEEFQTILVEIGENNEMYQLDDQVIADLYRILEEKQGGQITIEGIEALILQCLLEEQQVELQKQEEQEGEEIQFKELTLDSINQLQGIYFKAAGKQKDHCKLSDIERQIESLQRQGSLLLSASNALNIFRILSSKNSTDNPIVLNEDMQLLISKFQNFMLFNCGIAKVENEQSALVFHGSEDEEDNSIDGSSPFVSKKCIQSSLDKLSEEIEVQVIIDKLKEIFQGKASGGLNQLEILFKEMQTEKIRLNAKVEEKEAKNKKLKQSCELKDARINFLEKSSEEIALNSQQIQEHCQKLQEIIDKQNIELMRHVKIEEEHEILYKNLNASYKELQEKNAEIMGFKNKIATLAQQNKDIQQNYDIIYQELQNKKEKEVVEENQNQEDNERYSTPQNSRRKAGSRNPSREIILKLSQEMEQLKSSGDFQQTQIDNFSRIIEMKEEIIDELNREISNLKKQSLRLYDFDGYEPIQQGISRALSERHCTKHSETIFERRLSLKEDTLELKFGGERKSLQLKNKYSREGKFAGVFHEDDCIEGEKPFERISFLSQISDEGGEQKVEQQKILESQTLKVEDSNEQNENLPVIVVSPPSIENQAKSMRQISQNLIKLEQNYKHKNGFSQAAIEIIQSFREIKQEDVSSTPRSLVKIQNNNPHNAIESRMTQSLLVLPERSPSNRAPFQQLLQKIEKNNQKDLGQEMMLTQSEASSIKLPSFQQVLTEGAEHFWEEIKKNKQYQQNVSSKPKLFSFPQNISNLNEDKQNNIHRQQQQSPFKLYSTDYLHLKDDPRIKAIVTKVEKSVNQVKKQMAVLADSKYSDCFYSDSIYRINSSQEKERRILFSTSSFVYIVNPNNNFKVVRKINIAQINRLTFSNTNSNLCVVHVLNQAEYVIESCRRFDFNQFLSNLFRNHFNIPIYMVCFIDNLRITNKKKKSFKAHNSPARRFSDQYDVNEKLQAHENWQNQQDNITNTLQVTSHENQAVEGDRVRKNSLFDSKQTFKVLFKKDQNIIKRFFVNPWKESTLTIDRYKIIIKECCPAAISTEYNFNKVAEIGDSQLQITLSDSSSIIIKITNVQDYQSLLSILQSQESV